MYLFGKDSHSTPYSKSQTLSAVPPGERSLPKSVTLGRVGIPLAYATQRSGMLHPMLTSFLGLMQSDDPTQWIV